MMHKQRRRNANNAMETKERFFWEECFTMLIEPGCSLLDIADEADEALELWRDRFGAPRQRASKGRPK